MVEKIFQVRCDVKFVAEENFLSQKSSIKNLMLKKVLQNGKDIR